MREAPHEPERAPQPTHIESDQAGPTVDQAWVQPLDVTGVRTTAVGTFLWAVAFFALLPFRNSLGEQGRSWWMWTCVAGFVIGVIGVEYCRRRRDRLLTEPAREVETSPLGAAGL